MNLGGMTTPKGLVLFPLLMVLAFIIACGGAAATSAPEVKEEAPTPTLFIEVIKRAPATPSGAVATPSGAVATPSGAVATPSGAVATPSGAVATPVPEPTLAPAPALQAIYGGILPIQAYRTMITSRPLPAASVSMMIGVSSLYNQIMEYNPETADTLDIRCDLCRTWELSEDGLTYTYHFYEDARWSDGEPITSEDIIFTIDSIVDPDLPKFGDLWKSAKARSVSGQFTPYYESSRAIDDYTVEIKLKYPSMAFHSALALEPTKMMPEHQVMQGKLQGFANTDDMVTSGPFRFVDYTKVVSWEVSKNPDYFKEGRPYLDGVKVYVIRDAGTAVAAYASEQVLTSAGDANNVGSIESKQFLEDYGHKFNVYFVGPTGAYTFMMNAESELFDDPRVRRAMSLAINRQEIVAALGIGDLQIGTPFPPGTWFGPTVEEAEQLPGMRLLAGEKHPDDIAEAKRLLTEAGFPNGFEGEIVTPMAAKYVDIGTIIVQQLKEYLNVNLKQIVAEAGAVQPLYIAGEYDVAIQAKSLPFMDPDAGFMEYKDGSLIGTSWGRGYNQTNWDKLQDLFARQSSERDVDKRLALIKEASDSLIYEDHAAPNIYYMTATIFVHKKVQNFHAAPGSYTVGMKYEHLWCDPSC